MPLINSKIHFRLKYNKKCIYIPLVTLPTKGNVKLTKQLIDGYKWSIYWNKCLSHVFTQT